MSLVLTFYNHNALIKYAIIFTTKVKWTYSVFLMKTIELCRILLSGMKESLSSCARRVVHKYSERNWKQHGHERHKPVIGN